MKENTDKAIQVLKQAQAQRARKAYVYTTRLQAEADSENYNKDLKNKYTKV